MLMSVLDLNRLYYTAFAKTSKNLKIPNKKVDITNKIVYNKDVTTRDDEKLSVKDMEAKTMTQAELAKKFVEDMAPVDAKSEGFVIDDMGKARWAVDKIAEKRAEIDEIEKFAQMQINQIMEWAQKQKESANFEIGHWECLLEQFAQKELDGKKTKTLKLPNGRLVMGRKTMQIKKDDASLLAFVKENHGDFVKVKESVDWTEFKKTLHFEGGKAIDENGEIVPDVEAIETEGKFEVKLGF